MSLVLMMRPDEHRVQARTMILEYPLPCARCLFARDFRDAVRHMTELGRTQRNLRGYLVEAPVSALD